MLSSSLAKKKGIRGPRGFWLSVSHQNGHDTSISQIDGRAAVAGQRIMVEDQFRHLGSHEPVRSQVCSEGHWIAGFQRKSGKGDLRAIRRDVPLELDSLQM